MSSPDSGRPAWRYKAVHRLHTNESRSVGSLLRGHYGSRRWWGLKGGRKSQTLPANRCRRTKLGVRPRSPGPQDSRVLARPGPEPGNSDRPHTRPHIDRPLLPLSKISSELRLSLLVKPTHTETQIPCHQAQTRRHPWTGSLAVDKVPPTDPKMQSTRLLPLRHHLPRTPNLRLLRASAGISRPSSTFQSSPSPPRLPPDQQAEFERLQRAALSRLGVVGPEQPASSPSPQADQTTPSATLATSTSRHVSTPSPSNSAQDQAPPAQPETPEGGGVWRGAPPEFEGDTNPRTGEVGGPKNEPLRWGSRGDWSYNGRVTDF